MALTKNFTHPNSFQKLQLFQNVQAACESGCDFSSRCWMHDNTSLTSLYTTELIPVDLNVFLFNIENKLADYFRHFKNYNKAEFYQWRAEYRKQAIEKFCWDPEEQFHFDYCWSEEKRSTVHTL
ncbi:alpha,alpha-trehalase [Candidatus Coxiella mudrowiae]|uniref:alpha,alpha-trehalase n=1 Tax=Candidatus Coxiella mudrowiae TaxID=2054173 RepID=UPI001FD55AAA|nr:alpha,alpha-trehalase [Candidatus Coxiella mudrowiae]